jgi:hypothetical protein
MEPIKKRRTQAEIAETKRIDREAIKAQVRREILAEQKKKAKPRHRINAEQMQALQNGRA